MLETIVKLLYVSNTIQEAFHICTDEAARLKLRSTETLYSGEDIAETTCHKQNQSGVSHPTENSRIVESAIHGQVINNAPPC